MSRIWRRCSISPPAALSGSSGSTPKTRVPKICTTPLHTTCQKSPSSGNVDLPLSACAARRPPRSRTCPGCRCPRPAMRKVVDVGMINPAGTPSLSPDPHTAGEPERVTRSALPVASMKILPFINSLRESVSATTASILPSLTIVSTMSEFTLSFTPASASISKYRYLSASGSKRYHLLVATLSFSLGERDEPFHAVFQDRLQLDASHFLHPTSESPPVCRRTACPSRRSPRPYSAARWRRGSAWTCRRERGTARRGRRSCPSVRPPGSRRSRPARSPPPRHPPRPPSEETHRMPRDW